MSTAVPPAGGEFTIAAVEHVRKLIAAGILGPEGLGSATPADHRADTSAVPGTPIRLRALAPKCLDGITTDTVRTYRPYIRFLVDGWDGRTDLFPGVRKQVGP